METFMSCILSVSLSEEDTVDPPPKSRTAFVAAFTVIIPAPTGSTTWPLTRRKAMRPFNKVNIRYYYKVDAVDR